MKFLFSIHRIDDDSIVEVDDAFDKMVCDALGLEYNHVNSLGGTDYGHYYFPESREDPDVFGGQISISWVGFLNTVVEYSYIRTGKVTKYDMEAALAWCMNHSVEFPRSCVILMYKFMRLIIDNKYYLRVSGHSRNKFYEIGFVNPYDKSRIIENDTGFFLVDNKGILKEMFPRIENIIYNNRYGENRMVIKKITMPSEVNDIFRDSILYRDFPEIECLEISRDLLIRIIELHKLYQFTTDDYRHKESFLDYSIQILNQELGLRIRQIITT